jgi:hypothetical protein
MKTGRRYATCKCCQGEGPDVRQRNRFVDAKGNAGPFLCDACWADPHNKMSECLHGRKMSAARGE